MILFCAALITKEAIAGNGAGYGGGENQVLKQARTQISLAFKRLRDSKKIDSIGNNENCQSFGEPKLCEVLTTLTSEQQLFLSQFLKETMVSFIDLVATPQRVPIILSAETLEVLDPNGKPIGVSGRTQLVLKEKFGCTATR